MIEKGKEETIMPIYNSLYLREEKKLQDKINQLEEELSHLYQKKRHHLGKEIKKCIPHFTSLIFLTQDVLECTCLLKASSYLSLLTIYPKGHKSNFSIRLNTVFLKEKNNEPGQFLNDLLNQFKNEKHLRLKSSVSDLFETKHHSVVLNEKQLARINRIKTTSGLEQEILYITSEDPFDYFDDSSGSSSPPFLQGLKLN